MSSLPLISHHLFVAAVKAGPGEQAFQAAGPGRSPTSRSRAEVSSMSSASRPVHSYASTDLIPVSEVPPREFPMELVDFGRPVPVEVSWLSEAPDWIGSA